MKSRWLGALLSVRRKLGWEALGVSRTRSSSRLSLWRHRH